MGGLYTDTFLRMSFNLLRPRQTLSATTAIAIAIARPIPTTINCRTSLHRNLSSHCREIHPTARPNSITEQVSSNSQSRRSIHSSSIASSLPFKPTPQSIIPGLSPVPNKSSVERTLSKTTALNSKIIDAPVPAAAAAVFATSTTTASSLKLRILSSSRSFHTASSLSRSSSSSSLYPSSESSNIPANDSTNEMAKPLTIEETKRLAAREAVKNHYPPGAKYVGIGSGTTIVYVVESIKELGFDTSSTLYVPTGSGSKKLIENAGLTPIAFDMLPEGTVLDVAFDGADEVDDELNCIKGGGACLFQEKLVARQAKEFICVADYRKLQPRLLTNWAYIPIEIAPIARFRVLAALEKLGSIRPAIRGVATTSLTTGIKEFVPLKTDQDFYLIDAPFKTLVTSTDVAAGNVDGDGKGKGGVWEVETLCKEIKAIEGVLDVGIFAGLTGRQAIEKGLGCGGARPVAAYFGMTDGSVTVRKA